MIDNWTKEVAAKLDLPLSDVPAAQRLAGAPRTGAASLGTFGGCNIGVWEMTPGSMSDTEVDEILVVISGAATVRFEDGQVMTLAPGDIARLHAGQRTVWVVTETLRKVYLSLRS